SSYALHVAHFCHRFLSDLLSWRHNNVFARICKRSFAQEQNQCDTRASNRPTAQAMMSSYSYHAQNLRFLAAEGNGKDRKKFRLFQKQHGLMVNSKLGIKSLIQ